FIDRTKDSLDKQVKEVRAQLQDLCQLNKQLRLCALLQNHSPSGHKYFGGDLSELAASVEGFDPRQIGIAFDIGHALVVHGDGWRQHFDTLKPHFKIAYIKDVTRTGTWVAFGQGDIAATGYFGLLRSIGYTAPISMHIEYDWQSPGTAKDRASLLAVLRENYR